jgi:CRISPR system Cascade subunit CasA
MSRFNLIDEKWIPVRFPSGSRGELGIQDVLLRAKDIAAIEDPSPLVVAALHRFLLAVLYRALEGPTDIDQAKTLFKSGFPNDKITAYLDKWRDRFWLFDETYPFGQNPNVPKKEIEPWTKLAPEYNATSNKVLFDHTDTRNPGFRQPKECARWLIATMNFSLSAEGEATTHLHRPTPSCAFHLGAISRAHCVATLCLIPIGKLCVQILRSGSVTLKNCHWNTLNARWWAMQICSRGKHA